MSSAYLNLTFRAGGRTREGIDCAGLAMLWLREQLGIEVPDTPTDDSQAAGGAVAGVLQRGFKGLGESGSLVFFRRRKDTFPTHVATHLGGGRLLHILSGCESRIDNGITLLGRLGYLPCATVPPIEAPALAALLNDRRMGEATTIVTFIIGLALSFASSFLLRPNLPRLGNNRGRYSDGALISQRNPEIPLADVLGQVVVAGNLVYQQLSTPDATADPQRANVIQVLSTAPAEVDYPSLRIKGVGYRDASHYGGTFGGYWRNPPQTKDEAVTGTIASELNRPSLTIYNGAHGVEVGRDVRGQYDRTFPVHGLPGVTHIVYRTMTAANLSGFNATVRVKGSHCRTFTDAGFDVTDVLGESLAGADGSKVRFKLANADVIAVSSVYVNAVAYTEMSESNQTGNVFAVNRTKGYLEFVTAPATSAVIEVDYTYHPREWTRNPAAQAVYLLTENRRGRGWPEDKINWPAAEDFYDYCEDDVTWQSDYGEVTEARYTSDYAVDFRSPLQEHVRAVLDSAYAFMFISGGLVTLKARAAGSSVFSFDEDTMLLENGRSAFEVEDVDRQDRPNEIRVLFHSDETHNAEGEVARVDKLDQDERAERIGNEGVLSTNLKFNAVTRRTQAERLGEQVVRENAASRKVVQITTNIKGLAIEPGDLVDVTHASVPDWSGKLFRVEELSHDDQDRLKIKGSEYADVFV